MILSILMIYINHEKKALFIHIPKTGGSYIGPTLVKHYGFTSYIDLIHNRRPDHDIFCKTFQFKKILTGNYVYDNSFFNKMVGILCYCKTSDYFNTKMNMDITKWSEYTKFCFIRNPYDRVYSGWKHINIVLNKNTQFFHYISQNKYNVTDIEHAHVFMNQKTHIQDEEGNCGVDIIGKFENLEEDFKKILNYIGFDKFTHKDTKVNVTNKEGIDTLSFDIKTIRRLNEICDEDLETFHYKKIVL
jgi:hypothetical protein